MSACETMAAICNIHGPMKHHPALHWWECKGFDGEGCPIVLVYDEDLKWPGNGSIAGVQVVSLTAPEDSIG